MDTHTLSAETAASAQNDAHIPFPPQNLRQARLHCHLSIEEAAHLASLNKMTLLRYESGDIRTISSRRLHRLAEIYQVPPAWLMGISPRQEFFSAQEKLLVSPRRAEPPSRLGARLLTCLHFFWADPDAPPSYSSG